MENIVYARPFNTDAQMSIVTGLGKLLADPDQGPFRLVIVDSITSLFRTDYVGRGELSVRQQKLNEHLATLNQLASEFNVAILLVNQVMADPGANAMFGPVIRPIGKSLMNFIVIFIHDYLLGGHVLAHAVQTRILMKKGRDTNRICKIIDSPSMPEAEAMICLTTGGIDDADQ